MAIRRRRIHARSHGARRKPVWAQRTGTLAFTANSQWSNVDLLQEYKAATGASSVGITIVRTHIWVLPKAPAAGDTWWMGLRVDDLDQVATNTTNAMVSNPRDNPYVDWMFARKFEFDNSLFSGFGPSSWQGATLDLRSKRRQHEVQQAYLLTILQDSVATVAKSYDFFARTLILLP